MKANYSNVSPVSNPVENPCVKCKFYKKVNHGPLWLNSSLFCTRNEQEIIGYNPITGDAITGKAEQLKYARELACYGNFFINKGDL